MANELTHKDPGAELTQAEYIASDGTGHVFDSQATGDILYASSSTVLSRLAKGSDGNVLELASGLPAWTASPTIGSTSWGNANHAHAASNSGGTVTATGLSGSVLTGDVTTSGNAATLALSNLTGAAINVAADSIPFLDADGSATRIESIADLATAMAGANLTASSGQLAASGGGVPNAFFFA